MFPRITPLLSPDRPILHRLRPYITGSARVDTQTIRHCLPDRLADKPITPAHRTEVLTVPYLIGDDHILKLITSRTLVIQNLYIKLVNLQARLYGLSPFLSGYLKPSRAAEYRYNALEDSFARGAYVPEPVALTTSSSYSALLTKYHPTTDSFDDIPSTVSPFRSALATLRTLHTHGYIHGSVFSHLFLSKATNNALLTDPIGRASPDTYHLCQAFDIAGLLARFVGLIGSFSVLQQPVFDLPDSVLQFLPNAVRLFESSTRRDEPIRWLADDLEQALSSESTA